MQRFVISKRFFFTLLLPCFCAAQNYRPSFQWPQTLAEAKNLHLSIADASNVVNEGQLEPDPGNTFAVVNGFTFSQLERDRLYLVAVADTGKGFFNFLIMKYCGTAACTEAMVRAVQPHNLNDELVDLDGDGIDEIIAKEFAGGYQGAATQSIYKYTIYKVVDGKPVDVSSRYKGYYESTLLPKMKANVAALRAQAAGSTKELELIDALDITAQDDYQRRILNNARAGLDHAKEWIHSDNEPLRDYAVQIFTAISDPAVEQILTQMKADPNVKTAKAASSALESWRAMGYKRSAGPGK